MMRRPGTGRFLGCRTWRSAAAALTLLLTAALTITVVPATPRVAQATMPGPNGRIIFRDAQSGHLFTVNPDGTALRQVTDRGYAAHPDWSPDGRHIAYASNRSGFFAIWIADADGTHARQLTPNDPNANNFWPRFTPDGRTVVFTNCFGPDCDGGISAVRTDGTHLHAITPNSGESYNYAVPAPDGRRLAFMRWHVNGIKMRIYVMPFSGGAEHPVTPRQLEGWAPDWAPDGQRILFTSNIFFDRPNASLYTVRPDGTGLRRLTNPPWPFDDFEASYSPNGARIVFSTNRRYPDRSSEDLYVMTSDGGAMRRVPLPTAAAVDARWGTAPLLTGPSPTLSATSTATGAGAGRVLCTVLPTQIRGRSCPTVAQPGLWRKPIGRRDVVSGY